MRSTSSSSINSTSRRLIVYYYRFALNVDVNHMLSGTLPSGFWLAWLHPSLDRIFSFSGWAGA